VGAIKNSNGQPFPALRPTPTEYPSAGRRAPPSQKAVSSSPFFLSGLVCLRHFIYATTSDLGTQPFIGNA